MAYGFYFSLFDWLVIMIFLPVVSTDWLVSNNLFLVVVNRTNSQLVAFLSKYRDMNFIKSHGRDNAR